MPYKKYKRKSYKKKSYRKGNSLSRKVSYLMKNALPEKKTHDSTCITENIDNVGDVSTNLANIAQGDTEATRTGHLIRVKSIYLRGLITKGTGDNQLVRIALVRDKRQVADTTPTFDQVFDSTLANRILAPLNQDNKGRFQVLFDKVVSVGDNIKEIALLKYYKKTNIAVRFNGTGADDIESNGLWVCFVSNVATGATEPNLIIHSRVIFTDA